MALLNLCNVDKNIENIPGGHITPNQTHDAGFNQNKYDHHVYKSSHVCHFILCSVCEMAGCKYVVIRHYRKFVILVSILKYQYQRRSFLFSRIQYDSTWFVTVCISSYVLLLQICYYMEQAAYLYIGIDINSSHTDKDIYLSLNLSCQSSLTLCFSFSIPHSFSRLSLIVSNTYQWRFRHR